MKKYINHTAGFFIVLLEPFVIIFAIFLRLFYSPDFYKEAFVKTGVTETLANSVILETKVEEFLSFMKHQGTLDPSFYSSQAVTHLADVRELISFSGYLLVLYASVLGAFTLYLLVQRQTKRLIKSYFFGTVITLVTLFSLQIGIVKNFDQLFFQMHKMIFTNDLWLFPSTDTLIMLFPQSFFVLFASTVAKQIVIISAIIAVLSASAWYFVAIYKNKPTKRKRK